MEIVARELDQGTVDWEDFRARAATGVLADLTLGADTLALLERLAAVDGPLPAGEYAEHLGLAAPAFQSSVEEASSYSLVDWDERGFLRLHPLLRDFYMRAFRRRSDYRRDVSNLADRARTLLSSALTGSSGYVDALTTAFRLLCWAGRIDEAIELRRNLYGTLFETAMELYNQRRYEDAKRYFEVVIESSDDTRGAELYLARTLAYLGELPRARLIMHDLLERFPRDHHVWRIRGRVEFIGRQFDAAIPFYERANELRGGTPAVLRDLGQARIRVGDWFGARAALEAAISGQRRDPDPFLAFQYSQVLEHFEEFEPAREMMLRAVRRDPENVGFRFRLGRIAEKLGDRATAHREYERCLRVEPDYVEALVSLASLAADAGDVSGARVRLSDARAAPNARRPVLLTVEAKIALREQDFDGALALVNEALAEEGEVVSLGLAARVRLDAVAAGTWRCSDVSADVRQLAEAIRLKGRGTEADALLQRLSVLCQ